MTTITIPLSDERAAQLRLWAEEAGLPPEEFLRRRVEQLLDRPDVEFEKAADRLLKKMLSFIGGSHDSICVAGRGVGASSPWAPAVWWASWRA
jgi:hypothetical protein